MKLFSEFFSTVKKRHKAFGSDCNGQVMVFSALMLLTLAAFTGSVVLVGQGIQGKIQTQNAADAASMAAVTWMARGSNILQITNGIHWDANVLIADAIIVSCAVAAAEIAEDLEIPYIGEILAAADWEEERETIGELDQVHTGVADAIAGIQDTVHYAFPIIAFLHANGLAQTNGAEHLDLTNFPILKNFGIRLPSIPSVFQGVIPYTWTLSPSLISVLSTNFSKKVTPNDTKTAIHMSSTMPFTPCIAFAKFLNWNDHYYESQNADKAITFVCSRSPHQGYIFNKLLALDSRDDVIPAAYAVSAAKITNDKLYASGQKDTTYMCTPVAAVSLNPIPAVRIVTGYKGNFETSYTKVQFMGVSGEVVLVLH